MKSIVERASLTLRVVPIIDRSTVSGPRKKVSKSRISFYELHHTPNKICAIVKREQTRGELARPYHRRKNYLSPVVNPISRDGHSLGSCCHDGVDDTLHNILVEG